MDAFKKILETATRRPWRHYSGKLRPRFPRLIHEIQTTTGTAIVKWGGFDGADQTKQQVTANARLLTLGANHVEEMVRLLSGFAVLPCGACDQMEKAKICDHCQSAFDLLAKIEKEASED